MINPYRKVYVEVEAVFDKNGEITPKSIKWDDGRVYPIDKVLKKRRAASLKAGGQGIRYECLIRGNKKFIFHEETKWFIEIKNIFR